jgi:sugar lactone lactonase YvrE
MKMRTPSGRSFEDALLAELLAVHGELQRARSTPQRRAPSREAGRRHRVLGRLRPGDGPGGTGSGPKERWRAVVVVAGLAAAIVVGALVVGSLRSAGQRVTIRPAAQSSLPPGTVLVSQGGTTYARSRPGTSVRGLGAVTAYAPAVAGNAEPVANFTKGMRGPVTLAFSPSGDLWVANSNGSLLEFTRADLTKSNPSPNVTISGPVGVLHPYGLAFDPSGDLWVVNSRAGTVIEYTRAQLAKSGSRTPHTTISASYLHSPVGAAFDSSGDLWVANTNFLVEFNEHELAKPNPAPSVTISSASLDAPNPITFDASGDLWAANWTNHRLVEFTKRQLAKSGAPVAAVSISPVSFQGNTSIDGPDALAVDASGDLWVDNYSNNTVVEFAKDQLAKSGSPVPVRTMAGPKTRMNHPTFVVITR